MKHHLDLFVENEIKLICDIKKYLDYVSQGEFENFDVKKLDEDNYSFGFDILNYLKLETVSINSIGCMLNVIEIYEKSSKVKWNSLEELIELYLREQLVEEIKSIIEDSQKDITENEE